jgi:Predicted membrane protein (DUF2142).
MIKAVGVVHGQPYGNGTTAYSDSGVYPVFDVPAEIACTRLGDQPESCEGEGEAAIVPAASTTGYYNPTYYAIAGLPSVFITVPTLRYAMRLFSVLVVSGLAGVAFSILARSPRARTVVPLAVLTFSPLFFFLLGEVNPNAMEVTCAFGAAVALLRIIDVSPARAETGTWIGFVVFSVLLANVRSLGVGWLGLIVLLIGLVAGRERLRGVLRQRVARVGVVAVLVGVGVALFELRFSGALHHFIPVPRGRDLTPLQAFVTMIKTAPSEFEGMFVRLGLASTVVSNWWVLMFGVLFIILGALAFFRSKTISARVAIALCPLAYVFVPAVLQSPNVQSTGIIWQPRYEMGLLVAIVAICLHQAFPTTESRPSHLLARTEIVIGAVAFGIFAVLQATAVVGFAEVWNGLAWGGVLVSRGFTSLQPIAPGTAYPGRAVTLALACGLVAVCTALWRSGPKVYTARTRRWSGCAPFRAPEVR